MSKYLNYRSIEGGGGVVIVVTLVIVAIAVITVTIAAAIIAVFPRYRLLVELSLSHEAAR